MKNGQKGFLMVGPQSFAILVVREECRSRNEGVIILRNEMRHKSGSNADEVHHFTLFRRVGASANNIWLCNTCRCGAMPSSLIHGSHPPPPCTSQPCSPPSHRDPPVPSPTPLPCSGTSLTPLLSKLRLFSPQSIPSSPMPHLTRVRVRACTPKQRPAALCKSCKRRMSREQHIVDVGTGEVLASALLVHRLAR